jgi:hypothetical protein
MPGGADRALTVATYAMLLVFGAAQGVLGSFYYGSGPVPLAALGFDLAILATCLFGAWGLRRPAGAIAPAAGWIAATFLLAAGTSAGSVLVTATTAGEWFLFGGAAAVAAGVVIAFVLSPRLR